MRVGDSRPVHMCVRVYLCDTGAGGEAAGKKLGRPKKKQRRRYHEDGNSLLEFATENKIVYKYLSNLRDNKIQIQTCNTKII